MADDNMMDTLRSILGDDADEKIQTVLNNLNGVSKKKDALQIPENGNDYVEQIKNIVGRMGSANDTRSNLLLSLKPYMRAERQKSIDNAVRILNLTRFSGLFK